MGLQIIGIIFTDKDPQVFFTSKQFRLIAQLQ